MKKRFKFKNAFSTILVSYGAILLIPVIVACVLLGTANRLSAERSIDHAFSDIAHGKLLFEKQLDTMDSNCMYLTYDSLLKWTMNIEPLNSGDKNIVRINQFRERLEDVFSDNVIFQNYRVLLKNDYVFERNTMVTGREFYFKHTRNFQLMTYELWREKSFYSVGRSLIPLQQVGTKEQKPWVMTYNYPLDGGIRTEGEADAVVQISIPVKTLQEYFMPVLEKEGSRLLLLDKSGSILAALTKDGPALEHEIPLESMTENSGHVETRIDEMDYVMIYTKSEEDLIYVAELPKSLVFGDARELWSVGIGILSICLLVELGMGIWFAWKYTQPFRNLILNVQRMMKPDIVSSMPDTDNEYEQLERSFTHMIQTNRSMEKRNYLNYLLSGEFKQNEDILREGGLVGIKLGGLRYGVVVVSAGEYAEQLYIQIAQKSWNYVLAVQVMDKENLVFLLGDANLISSMTEAEAREIVSWMERTCTQQFGAGIGRIYEEETDIMFSYMQACYSHGLKGKQECIVSYQDISQDANSLYYPSELEEKLINSTKYGDIHQIEHIFTQLWEENLNKRHLSKTMKGVLGDNILGTLLKVYNDVIPSQKLDGLVDKIYHRPEIEGVLAVLEEQFVFVSQTVENSRDQREECHRKRLVAYVEENYTNSQMGVSMAAEEFSFSENYFSQFFKEIMEVSFSGYLENVRLNRAKQLIEEGAYDLEQIASMVGYNNSGTFRRAFKRQTSASPSTWKQRKQEEI